jgi:hypothetical protein
MGIIIEAINFYYNGLDLFYQAFLSTQTLWYLSFRQAKERDSRKENRQCPIIPLASFSTSIFVLSLLLLGCLSRRLISSDRVDNGKEALTTGDIFRWKRRLYLLIGLWFSC